MVNIELLLMALVIAGCVASRPAPLPTGYIIPDALPPPHKSQHHQIQEAPKEKPRKDWPHYPEDFNVGTSDAVDQRLDAIDQHTKNLREKWSKQPLVKPRDK